jgi:hypothetical protein
MDIEVDLVDIVALLSFALLCIFGLVLVQCSNPIL